MFKSLKVLIFIFILFFFPSAAYAQDSPPPEEFYKAEVTKIITSGEKFIDENKTQPYQTVQVKILDGKDKGKEITVDHGKLTTISEEQKVAVGEKVVLLKLPTPKGFQYQIIDRYRLNTLLPILMFFFILVLVLSRWKGLGSIVGLAVSLSIIMFFIVPQILAGRDPLFISIVGSLFIMTITIYLAHGFSRKTHIALASTFLSLSLTGFLAYFFVDISHLTGLGNDDASSLRFGQTENINFQGLLLGGIIIGALGVLDDITTSLSAVIEELKKQIPNTHLWIFLKADFV
jgi:uncharacterized membrane protein